MIVPFLTTFAVGIILAVIAMLGGIKQRTGFRIDLPMVSGFATAFGAVGYPLTRYTSLRDSTVLLLAGLAGVAGGVAALMLVGMWAIPAAKAEVVDERYLLQGALAQVTAVDADGASGTIKYTIDGKTNTAPARGLDGAHLEIGSEVAIERVEGGITYVEPWARVEARL